MRIATTVVIIVIALSLLGLAIFLTSTPAGVELWNNWTHKVQKADDSTNYKTLKKVEDTCRAMIASYNSDRLTYEQYKDSDDEEKQSWAEQARMRANKTASSYNQFILKNSYVWKDNIPSDIQSELQYIEERRG